MSSIDNLVLYANIYSSFICNYLIFVLFSYFSRNKSNYDSHMSSHREGECPHCHMKIIGK